MNKPGLETDERDRAVRADRLAERHAGVAVETRRHIQRKYRPARGVDLRDDLRESRVATPPLSPVPSSASTMTSPSRSSSGENGRNCPPLLLKSSQAWRASLRSSSGETAASTETVSPAACAKRAEHISVTAVVAAAAHDHDAMSHRPARAQVAQRRLAGALHQGVAGNALHVDGVSIERANLCGGIQGDRQCHAVIILTAVATP